MHIWRHQSSASLAFVGGIHRWPVNFSHKGPATRKMFPLDDVIMCWGIKNKAYGSVTYMSIFVIAHMRISTFDKADCFSVIATKFPLQIPIFTIMSIEHQWPISLMLTITFVLTESIPWTYSTRRYKLLCTTIMETLKLSSKFAFTNDTLHPGKLYGTLLVNSL